MTITREEVGGMCLPPAMLTIYMSALLNYSAGRVVRANHDNRFMLSCDSGPGHDPTMESLVLPVDGMTSNLGLLAKARESLA